MSRIDKASTHMEPGDRVCSTRTGRPGTFLGYTVEGHAEVRFDDSDGPATLDRRNIERIRGAS